MKTILFIFFFTTISTTTFAQNLNDLNQYPLESIEDCKKAEAKVVECVDYLFGHPVSKSDANRDAATLFVVKWMNKTNFPFTFDAIMHDLTNGSINLLGLYMAGMCKVVLGNPEVKLSEDEIKSKAVAMLIAYCKDEKNKCKPTKALKKLM
jgi:hypothetical protein